MLTSLLSLTAACSAAYMAPTAGRPAVSQRAASGVSMGLNKKVVSFDQDGLFEGREVSMQKPPLKLLERVEELQILSSIADAGLLSAAEDAGLFSKLEAQGAFSKVEALLPLADDLKLLSTAEGLLNTPSWYLTAAAAAILAGEFGLITVVPDDNIALLGIQAVTAAAAGAGAVTLIGTSYLFSLLQGEN